MTRRVSYDLCLKIYDAEVSAGALCAPEKLRSALLAPFQTFGGDELYPTLLAKAARLTDDIAEAQAFLDGNKRTAWLIAVVFLELNGLALDVDEDEAAHVVRAIGTRGESDKRLLDFEGLVSWFSCCAVRVDHAVV